MNIVIVAIALTVDPTAFYTPYQAPQAAPSATDFYTPMPTKVEETPKEPWDPRKVVVYIDLTDHKLLKEIGEDLEHRHELEYDLRSKDKVPAEAASMKLPVLHFTMPGGKFGFKSGWTGVKKFERYFFAHNPQIERDQETVSAPATRAPARSTSGSGYRARSYEWHLVRGENAQSLRIHLSVQQPEHEKGSAFPIEWLNTLSFHELVGLHSDAHNRRVQWDQVPAASSASKKEKKELGRAFYGTRDGKHPGPLGSGIRAFFGDPRYQYSCPNGNCPWSR